ncbi:MAG: S1C family serine protease [Thermomicrobiales bacterium]|jgi:S1-C subfamily serine protease|nr:trypsin-like peptidase domain-containing protein [Thermomicrobiales bacterium]
MRRRRFLTQLALFMLALLLTLAGCSLTNGTTQKPATATSTLHTTNPTATTNSVPLSQQASAAATTTSATTGSATTGSAGSTPAGAAPPAALPDVAGVAQKVRPATVLILNIVQGRSAGGSQIANPGGQPGDVPQGAGTGFIIDASGVIVTNNHVVEGAQKLSVVLPDGQRFDNAQLLGADPQTDLAVIKVPGEGKNLPTVPLGSSSQLQVGEWVVAIGNALALKGGPTVTAGVVSATGRDEQEPGETRGSTGPILHDLIQTDAAINPGNSGGPLVNMKGEVVGINTLGASDAQGIGFAISIDSAKPVIDALRQGQQVAGRGTGQAYLGIQSLTVTPSIAAANGLSRNDGVVVVNVITGTPAQKAGLQQGDIIIGLDNTAIADQNDLQNALQQHKPGDTVTLKIDRNGTQTTVQITLGDRPQQ